MKKRDSKRLLALEKGRSQYQGIQNCISRAEQPGHGAPLEPADGTWQVGNLALASETHFTLLTSRTIRLQICVVLVY